MKRTLLGLAVALAVWTAGIVAQEKEFVIVIPTYNNARWHKKCLDSVLGQTYENYHVVIVDDMSEDGNADLVELYIKEKNISDTFTLIRNKERVLACANFYKVIHRFEDHKIIVQLDGDDWFAHERVLEKLNAVYQDQNVWMTYGSYKTVPETGYCVHEIPQDVHDRKVYRYTGHVCATALRTFYAGLFKRIKRADLMYSDGKFLQAAYDIAFMAPMLEMAGDRAGFIGETLYIYNLQTGLNDETVRSKLQKDTEAFIRGKKRYQKLDRLLPEKEETSLKKLTKEDIKGLIKMAREYHNDGNSYPAYHCAYQAWKSYKQSGVYDENLEYRICDLLSLICPKVSNFPIGESAIDRMLAIRPNQPLVWHRMYSYTKQWNAQHIYIQSGAWGRLFDMKHPHYGKDDGLRSMYTARSELKKYGYKLVQADELKDVGKDNPVIVYDVPLNMWDQVKKFQPKNLVLFLWEPPSTKCYNYDSKYHEQFSKVYTWNDALVDNKKYFKFYYPMCRPMIEEVVPYHQKNGAVAISCDKFSSHPNELYSARRNVIQFYEKNGSSFFDLYGRGWKHRNYKTYKGEIATKQDILKNYKFCYCFENIKGVPGYVTEKIFDAFAAGTVPIYWGATNIEQYIPKSCFIDRRDFANEQDVYKYIKSINKDEYEQYIANIRLFLKSEMAYLYSVDNFVRIMHDAVKQW